jgi:tetratricopeptide (TPR) repeat protein
VARLKAEEEAQRRSERFAELRHQGEEAQTAARYDDAVRAFEEALALQDDAGVRDLLQKAKEARKEAQDKAQKARFDELRKQGEEARKEGQFDTAVKAFEDALKIQDDPQVRDVLRAVRKAGYDRAMLAGRKAAEVAEHQAAADAFRDALRYIADDKDAKTGLDDALFQVAFAKGRRAFEARQWANATTAFKDALTLRPEHKESKELWDKARGEWRARLMEDGRQAATLGRHEESIKAFTAARDLHADDEVAGLLKESQFQLKMQRGRDDLSGDRSEEAIAAFKDALSVKPDDASASEKLQEAIAAAYRKAMAAGDAALKATNYAAAITAYKHALDIKPDDRIAKRRLNEAQTEDGYSRAMEDAKVASQKQDWARAIAGFDKALEWKRGDGTATIGRDKAQREKRRRDSYDEHVKAGKSYLNLKNFPLAKTEFLAALGEFPGDKTATELLNAAVDGVTKKRSYDRHLDQGKTYLAGMKYDDAATEFRAALLDFPGDSEATGLLNKAVFGKAKLSYDKHMTAGKGHLDLKKYADAEREYQAALTDVAGDAEAMRLLRVARARQSYEKHMLAGRGHLEFKKYADAEREFQAALSDVPGDAEANRLLTLARSKKK